MTAARERTLRMVAHLEPADLERQVDPIMSPLVWDLAHIAAYEDLWLAHRFGGEPLLQPELAAAYDAFETPRTIRGALELLDAPRTFAFMAAVRERTARVTVTRGTDPVLHEMVLRHELQHTETMRQAMRLGGLLPPREPPDTALAGADGWIEIPTGPFAMGAGEDGFAYDNERPRHRVKLPAFAIARRPVTNASWLRFAEGGGYERREWWTDEGWAWKEDYDITHHPGASGGHPDAPVCCVSWFEAAAFAASCGARLPTEAEWEKAATWDQGPGTTGGPTGAGLASPALVGAGLVWEWTTSPFRGYAGFVAHPYREYSEVFFGDRYRVLRGGSWATHPRVATRTFRNWDLPERRQLFAGLRLARDLEAA